MEPHNVTIISLCGIVVILLLISVILLGKGRLKPSDWLTHPLGIPTGSVRALLAILIVFVMVLVAMSDNITIKKDVPEWLLGIMGAVVGFYFGGRALSLPKKEEDISDKLEKLRVLKDNESITDKEYQDKKLEILSKY